MLLWLVREAALGGATSGRDQACVATLALYLDPSIDSTTSGPTLNPVLLLLESRFFRCYHPQRDLRFFVAVLQTLCRTYVLSLQDLGLLYIQYRAVVNYSDRRGTLP